MDILFHIGLGKCGSSTLQNKVFRNLPGFMGTAKDIAWRDNFAKQFQSFSPVAGRQTGNLRLAAKWAESVRKESSKRRLNGHPIIVSNETLSAANRISWRPIIKFLSSFSQKHWTVGQVKILVVFRAQPSRLASLYAQSSRCNPAASQSDFEKFAFSFLKRNRPVFDYSLWYHDLVESFGGGNICMLPLEAIDSGLFWERMKGLLSLDEHSLGELRSASNDRANERKLGGSNSWKISDFDPEYCADIEIKKWLNFLWPSSVFPKAKRSASEKLQHFLSRARAQESKSRNAVLRRDAYIELSSNLEEYVRSVYRASNENLSRHLGIELKSYGY